MLRGAIFDLGETLIHLTVSWEQVREGRIRAIYETLRQNETRLDLSDLKREYVALHDEESEYAARTYEEIKVEESLAKLLDRLHVNERPEMTKLVNAFFALEADSWVVFPGVHEMLGDVRDLGVKMGLLSNARSDWAVKEIMRRLDLTKCFDEIVTSAAVGFRKPRPEPFRRIFGLLGLEASEAVMIGNSIEADISGARALGMKTIHAVFGSDENEKGADPDIVVSRVPDILPAIKRVAASA
jgi:putative hydrolase of the HAD superfamily